MTAGFRITRMYHPSLHVPDLAEAEDFFARVFGRPSVRLSTMFGPPREGRSVPDHSTFTLIGDVLMDSIDPRRYVIDGWQCYPDVGGGTLRSIGWYTEGVGTLYRSLRARGIVLVDQRDAIAGGEDPPTAVGSEMPLFFTVATDVGLRHELVPAFDFPLDPRCAPGWTMPRPDESDPLGIVGCAHHTVLTSDPSRALRLLVDGFGGAVTAERRDDVLASMVTVVALAGSVIHLAVPEDPSAVSSEADRYHSIAWRVEDVDRVERHLRAEGVGIAARTPTVVVADAATALGIPWRFNAGT